MEVTILWEEREHNDLQLTPGATFPMADKSVSQAAKQTATSVRTFLAEQVDGQVNGLGQKLAETSASVRTLADHARQDPNVAVTATLADQAGSLLDRAAAYLQARKADEVVRDFEAYSRKQPLIATLAATAVGFGVSRALKASSTRRSHEDSEQ